MSSTNKKGAGLILSLLTAVAGAVGLGFCIVNAGTDSFRKIGTSPVVIGCAVIAILALVLRGVLDDGVPVKKGMKSGDVDPRCKPEYCTTISDKALAVGGGVVEAVLYLRAKAQGRR